MAKKNREKIKEGIKKELTPILEKISESMADFLLSEKGQIFMFNRYTLAELQVEWNHYKRSCENPPILTRPETPTFEGFVDWFIINKLNNEKD